MNVVSSCEAFICTSVTEYTPLCSALLPADNNHRLNLFYLANDVIQNCKRKNAIIFRSAFADVLPNAAQFIR